LRDLGDLFYFLQKQPRAPFLTLKSTGERIPRILTHIKIVDDLKQSVSFKVIRMNK
jgi:hypothetical protein